MILTESNLLMFAARHYDCASACSSMEDFEDDLSRLKYVKRLINKYKCTGELRERLILNHIIVLYNMFGNAATPMLFLKLEGQWDALKPFLVLLNRLPETINDVGKHKTIYTSEIPLDMGIVNALRQDMR